MSVVTLAERVGSLSRGTIAEALELAAKDGCRIVRGTPASADAIAALEERLAAKFPADYRAFLAAYGDLEVVGNDRYGFGFFYVHGITKLEPARAELRDYCRRTAPGPTWLDAYLPLDRVPVPTPSELADKRADLGDELGLLDADLEPFFGDYMDKQRVNYRSMLPIIQLSDVLHQGVACIGPHGQLYEADLKSADLTPARRKSTFTSLFLQRLGDLVVA